MASAEEEGAGCSVALRRACEGPPPVRLQDVLDLPAIRELIESFAGTHGLALAILDLEGTVLLQAGFQPVCDRFHRKHPESSLGCVESDTVLTRGVPEGTCATYRCRNGLWDAATPLVVDGSHVGNLFVGQFFLDDEEVDLEAFRLQALRYGFEERAYLDAVGLVPRLDRRRVEKATSTLAGLARVISTLGHRNLALARALAEKDELVASLRQSDAQHRALLAHAGLAVTVWSLEGRLLYLNDHAAAELGRPPDALVGLEAGALMGERERALLQSRLRAVSASGRPGTFEDEVASTRGTRWFVSTFAPVLGPGAEVTGVQVFSHEITGHKVALAELRESEARYEALFENAPMSIWEEDFSRVREVLDGLRADGVEDVASHLAAHPGVVERCAGLVRVLRINETSVAFFGRGSKADVLTELPAYFGEDSLPVFRDELVALASGATRFECEIPIHPPGAEARLVRLSLSVVAGFERSLGRVVVSFVDVTARRRAEEKLRRSEERLRIAAEAADFGTFLHDLESDTITADERCRSLFGLPGGEVPFFLVLARVLPEDREQLARSFETGLRPDRGDGRVALEYRIVGPDGAVRWVSVFLKVTFEGEGAARRPVSSVGTTQDVTARKRIEEALRTSEAQQRHLVESLPAGVFVHAPDGRVLFANERACALLGLTLGEMQRPSAPGARWPILREDGSLVPPGEQPVAQVVSSRRPIDDVVVGIRRPEPAGDLWVQVSAYPELDALGEVVRIVVTFIDVTRRMQAQAELRVLGSISRLFQRDQPLAATYAETARVLVRDLRFPIAAVELFDREGGEMVFAGIEGIPGAAPGLRIPVDETLSGLVATRGEPLCLSDAASAPGYRSAHLRRLEVETFVCAPVVIGGAVTGTIALADPCRRADAASWLATLGVVASTLAQEIGRRRAEEALHRAQKLEALGTLAGGVAHDFNNILLAIRGNAVLAAGELPDGHPAHASLAEIDRAGTRAASLVGQILGFARPREGTRSVASLRGIVDEAVTLLRAALPARIELGTSSTGDVPAAAVDSGQVHQAVVNLVTNSAHAIGARDGLVSLALDAVDLPDGTAPGGANLRAGRYVRLTVQDDGCGMDRETLARAFDPFFTTRGPGEGSGLGLSIVHGIMRGHGGAATIRSEPGRGTTVVLLFPAAGEPAPSAPAVTRQDPAPQPHRARLLLVDDDDAIVRLSARYLGRSGFRVTALSDPREAVERVERDPSAFDAVVTDLSMPGMSGFAVARRVRLARPGLPVVLTSGYVRPEDEAEAARLGIDAFVAKPDSIDQLAATLAGILSNRLGFER